MSFLPLSNAAAFSRRCRAVCQLGLGVGLLALSLSAAIADVPLTPVATGLPTPSGIDCYSPTQLIVSYNVFPNTPALSGADANLNNLQLVNLLNPTAATNHGTFTNISGIPDEVKLFTVRPSMSGLGFTVGDVFHSNGYTGTVARIPAGSQTETIFATLPGEAGFKVGGITLDTTGQFGNKLLVTTTHTYSNNPLKPAATVGNVYTVDAAGHVTLLAALPFALEGACVVPNNPALYGPFAGQVLAASDHGNMLVGITPAGQVIPHPIPIPVYDLEDIKIIPTNSFFYGVDYINGQIWGSQAGAFNQYAGDLLLVDEGGDYSSSQTGHTVPGRLIDLKVTNTIIASATVINSQAAQWEQVTFCPAGSTPANGTLPLTQGYWKNHPNAWPVSSLTLGGTTYTEQQLIDILKTAPQGGDAVLILAHQLIAAKLNYANGAPMLVNATINDADALLATLGADPLSKSVSSTSSLGQQMINDANILDAYNNIGG